MLYRVLNILLLCLIVCAAVVQAEPVRVSGLAELRYGQHRAKEGGKTVIDAGHFTQKYSVLFEKSGKLSNGKLGSYDLALGYEWNYIDSTRDNDVSVDIDSPLDKILYKGDVLLAPGGLPFRMHAFSYDLGQTTFIEEDLSVLFKDRSNFSPDGGTIVGFENSRNMVSGLSLVAGLKNGSYSGRYRDLLTSMPRLLIDYRQVDVKDTDTLTPRHYTDRDLAFVSLNKRDNWFHYRVFTHDDHLDSRQDLDEETFLIGNIDHTYRREWIDLTNWIQVSTDLSYSELKPNVTVGEEKRYDMNLFSRASRANWQAANYTSFSRIRDDFGLEKWLDVPFFANGELSRDVSWRYQLQLQKEETDRFSGNVVGSTERGTAYTFLKLDTFRQERQLLSPYLEASFKDGTEGEGYALRLGAEVYSNPAFRSSLTTFFKYDVALFDGTSESGEDVDYFEQTAEVNLLKELTPSMRLGLSGTLVHGSGQYGNDIADSLRAQIDGIFDTIESDGNIFYGRTTASLEHNSPRRIDNRIELDAQFLNHDGDTFNGVELSHSVTHFGRLWNVRMDNYIFSGDRIASSELLSTQYDFEFGHESFIEYHPSRQVSASLRAEYDYFEAKRGGSVDRLFFVHRYEYSFWKNSGLIRKLFDLGEEVEYNRFSDLTSRVIDDYVTFSLFGNYYPTRSMLFGTKFRYEIDNVSEADTFAWHLLAELDMAKFKISLNYSYGERTESLASAERSEHRWEAKVKKLF